MHVTGRVDSLSEVQHRNGNTAAGKAYSFYQQVATLALGGHMIEVVYREDKEPSAPLCTFELDQVVRVKVESPRIFNGRTSFDASK